VTRLADLDPVLKGTVEDGFLRFDCPHPGCSHQVGVHISSAPYHKRPLRPNEMGWVDHPSRGAPPIVKVWQASGEFPDSLTLRPSIDIIEADEEGNKIRTLCWHGFITNGAIGG
jgi:hypothetical protein